MTTRSTGHAATLRTGMVALLVLTQLLLGLGSMQPAEAASAPRDHRFVAPWATVNLTVVRDGWTVRYDGTIRDTRADGDCVYARIKVDVDNGRDTQRTTRQNCGGRGNVRAISGSILPGKGRSLRSVVVTVCADDAPPDSCRAFRVGVPRDRAVRPGKRAVIGEHLDMPMRRFQRIRRAALNGGPTHGLVWSSDGCSNVPEYEFVKACQRHDFGYRNLGKRPVKAAPFAAAKDRVDGQFLKDMRAVCEGKNVVVRSSCRDFALGYYQGVRNLGGRAFWHVER